jgi:hypothetical protein
MSIGTISRKDGCWRNMATIEVDAECGDLDDILEDITFDSRLERTLAPKGKLRFDLMVNASRGADRTAMAAYALLSALDAIAEAGGLPGFVLVAGEHWLNRATARQSQTSDADSAEAELDTRALA